MIKKTFEELFATTFDGKITQFVVDNLNKTISKYSSRHADFKNLSRHSQHWGLIKSPFSSQVEFSPKTIRQFFSGNQSWIFEQKMKISNRDFRLVQTFN